MDATTRSTNTSPVLQAQDNEDTIQSLNITNAKPQLFDSKKSVDNNIPESLTEDTGKPFKDHKVSTNIQQTNIDLEVQSLQDPLQIGDPWDFPDGDTTVPNSDAFNDESYNTVIEAIPNCHTIQVDQPVNDPEKMDKDPIPVEKVGCIFLTECLQKYLDENLQLADNQLS